MVAEKPVVSEMRFDGGPVNEDELDKALEYAQNPKGKYKKELDRDILRLVVNTVIGHREPGVILPFLTAEVVRKVVPYAQRKDALKYEAYKGAAMKVFSDRSAWKSKTVARKRAQARSQPPPGKAGSRKRYPEDTRPKHKGQLKML